MVPLAGYKTEFDNQEKIIRDTAAKVFEEQGVTVDYLVGTMIEVPGAALTAEQIAEKAEFFSFGTNDLTQTTLGISRDDYKGSSAITWSTTSSPPTRSRRSTRPAWAS